MQQLRGYVKEERVDKNGKPFFFISSAENRGRITAILFPRHFPAAEKLSVGMELRFSVASEPNNGGGVDGHRFPQAVEVSVVKLCSECKTELGEHGHESVPWKCNHSGWWNPSRNGGWTPAEDGMAADWHCCGCDSRTSKHCMEHKVFKTCGCGKGPIDLFWLVHFYRSKWPVDQLAREAGVVIPTLAEAEELLAKREEGTQKKRVATVLPSPSSSCQTCLMLRQELQSAQNEIKFLKEELSKRK